MRDSTVVEKHSSLDLGLLALYEKRGDTVANELVDWFNAVDAAYRDDLRKLNELNFARFEVKIERLEAKIDRLATAVEGKGGKT